MNPSKASKLSEYKPLPGSVSSLGLVLLAQIPQLSAATLEVTTNADTIADDGKLSLREAIASAASGDVIRFADDLDGAGDGRQGDRLDLVLGEPLFTSGDLEIVGDEHLVIDGLDETRMFFVRDGRLTLRNMRLQSGLAQGGHSSKNGGGAMGAGGAVFVDETGALVLEDVRFSGNRSHGGNTDWGNHINYSGGGGGGLGGQGQGGRKSIVGESLAGGDGGGLVRHGGSFGPNEGGAGGAPDGGDAPDFEQALDADGNLVPFDDPNAVSYGATDFGGGGGGGLPADDPLFQAGDGGDAGFGGGGGGGAGSWSLDPEQPGRGGDGGDGGFGGGGGGGGNSVDANLVGKGGIGGLGGGDGRDGEQVADAEAKTGGGGGGAALGGAIFVREGGRLTISDSLDHYSVLGQDGELIAGNAGREDVSSGETAGTFLFLQGAGQSVEFNLGPKVARSLAMESAIADETSLDGGVHQADVMKSGEGFLTLRGLAFGGQLELQGGVLEASGRVGAFSGTPGATWRVTLDGESPAGPVPLQVSDGVQLGSANLDLLLIHQFIPDAGSEYLLIDQQGSAPVDGTFQGLPEGATVTGKGGSFRITYQGGDGNDVALLDGAALPIPSLRVEGNGLEIAHADGQPSPDDFTHFGWHPSADPALSREFLLINQGQQTLSLADVSLQDESGLGGWTLTPPAEMALLPGKSLALRVDFDANQPGIYGARINIASNDPVIPDYHFQIRAIVDDTQPAASSKPNLSAESDSGVSSNDDLTNVATPDLFGTADPFSRVELFRDGGVSLGVAHADEHGAWELTADTIPDGTFNIRARATDRAGNASGLSDPLVVTIDTQPPIPAISLERKEDFSWNLPYHPRFEIVFNEDVCCIEAGDFFLEGAALDAELNVSVGDTRRSAFTFTLYPTRFGWLRLTFKPDSVTDNAGNHNEEAVSYELFQGAGVIINEIGFDAQGRGAFVEVVSRLSYAVPNSEQSMHLDYYNPGDNSTQTLMSPDRILPAGGAWLLCSEDFPSSNCLLRSPRIGEMSSSSGALILRRDDPRIGEVLLDQVGYGAELSDAYSEPPVTLDGGIPPLQGLSRVPDREDTDNNENDFALRCVTPGFANAPQAAEACYQVSVSDAQAVEEGAGQPLEFVVELTHAADQEVVVEYQWLDGSASVVQDLDSAANGSVRFPAGDNSPRTISASILDDALDEGQSENIVLRLTGVSANALLGDLEASGEIIDDDGAGVEITLNHTEMTEGGAPSVITLALRSQPSADVTIEVGPAAGEASQAGTRLRYTFTPQNWKVSQQLTWNVIDDSVDHGERTEVFSFSVTSDDPTYHGLPLADQIVTIHDNDLPGDNDGVDGAIERAAPNDGDGNGDGIADAIQDHVASFRDAFDQSWITLEVSGGCDQIPVVLPLAVESDPQGYLYPFGQVQFQLPCEVADVRWFLHDAPVGSDYLYRKFAHRPPYTGKRDWFNLNGVVSASATVGGRSVATLAFQLRDGAIGDATPDDGLIADPGGPALAPAIQQATPIPTSSRWSLVTLWLLIAAITLRRFLLRQASPSTAANPPGCVGRSRWRSR